VQELCKNSLSKRDQSCPKEGPESRFCPYLPTPAQALPSICKPEVTGSIPVRSISIFALSEP
jgi:hypothetical protein